MAAIRLNLVWFVSLIFCHYSLIFASHVPVFMWSKDSSLSPEKPILAGHTILSQDFQEKYLRSVLQKTQTVVLFLQDKLSIDDLTRYGDAYSPGSHGDAFTNLKLAIQEANSSVVLPSVDITPSKITDNLVEYVKKNIKGQVIDLEGDERKAFKANQYPLDNKVTNVFIFHLDPVELSSPELVFKANDEMIAMATKEISKLETPYTCILTAQAPNKDASDLELAEEMSSRPHDRLRRDVQLDGLKAKNVPTVVYKNNTLFAGGCVFVYMKGLRLRYSNVTINFFNKSDNISGTIDSTCANYSAVTFNMSLNIHGFAVLKLSGAFNSTRSGWKCLKFSVTIKGNADVSINETLVFPCTNEIQVPRKMSYHCYNSTFTSGNYSLDFINFQIQPYDIKTGKFSYAYDCVGFFSIPILMGLFTTGILLLILFFGIMAVFSITTMDRFDDPKGSLRSFGTAG